MGFIDVCVLFRMMRTKHANKKGSKMKIRKKTNKWKKSELANNTFMFSINFVTAVKMKIGYYWFFPFCY